ncbi:hypothetical protein CYY_003143 [Polysphondylium violaceum]|uniref:Uncharacterized protein n=1 Tax=Polysphondylium violaceum TaxID=133409 RepID=A0A8J4V678_9MYCE|nr:hypothetical protein CYY_003143 [Polysphondylium violaceum]
MINKSNSKDSLNRKSNLINKNNTNTNNNSSNKQLINNNNKNNASFNDDIKYKKNRANSFVVDNGEDELYEEINNNQNNNNYVDEELIEAATVNKSTTSQQSNIVSAYNRLGPKALYCIGIFESILAILEMFFVMFLLNSLQAILSKRLLTIDITNSNSNYTYPQDNGNDSDKTTINNDSNNNNNSGDQLSAYDLQNSSFIFIIFMISQLISIIYFAKRNRLLLNLDYLKSSYQNLNNVASSLASLPIYLKENQLILLPKWLGIGSIKKVSIKESLKFIVFQFLLFIIIIMYQYQSNFWFFNFDNINVDSNPLPSSSKGSHSSNSHTSIIKTMDELKASYNNLTIDFSKLLAYTIVAPIFEELFFRGLITFKMSRR